MMKLIFVRHGETAWSRSQEFRFRGRVDIPLTDLGVSQAQTTGVKLSTEQIFTVYSSPLKRARDTAKAIAKFHDLEVKDHSGFIDLDFGTWEGKRHEKIQQEWPEEYTRWKNQPNSMKFSKGETLPIVRDRVENALSNLASNHLNETIVVVTHGAVLRVILCFLHEKELDHYWDYHMDNCALLIVNYAECRFLILAENANEHLKNE